MIRISSSLTVILKCGFGILVASAFLGSVFVEQNPYLSLAVGIVVLPIAILIGLALSENISTAYLDGEKLIIKSLMTRTSVDSCKIKSFREGTWLCVPYVEIEFFEGAYYLPKIILIPRCSRYASWKRGRNMAQRLICEIKTAKNCHCQRDRIFRICSPGLTRRGEGFTLGT